MTAEQLLNAIRTLRHTFMQGSKRGNCAGFAEPMGREQMNQIRNPGGQSR